MFKNVILRYIFVLIILEKKFQLQKKISKFIVNRQIKLDSFFFTYKNKNNTVEIKISTTSFFVTLIYKHVNIYILFTVMFFEKQI